MRKRRAVDEEVVVALVSRERRQQPRLGTRKLQRKLRREFAKAGITVGRDQLFGILRERGMLVAPLRRSVRTTDSRHALPVFRNLVWELTATGPHQIWVSDLTYIRTDEGYEYLSLVMDLHSRKIVGYHCGPELDVRGTLKALDGAIGALPGDRYPIHHSDRGCQYCCHEYVERLRARGLPVSMTEENHCYENAFAERLNGILKQEYGLGAQFRTRSQARAAVDQAVWLYNTQRPHSSLGLQTPAQVHGKAA